MTTLQGSLLRKEFQTFMMRCLVVRPQLFNGDFLAQSVFIKLIKLALPQAAQLSIFVGKSFALHLHEVPFKDALLVEYRR